MLRRAFESFDRDKKGYISPETVGDILRMMGIKVSSTSLKSIIEEIDEDGKRTFGGEWPVQFKARELRILQSL